MITLDNNFRIEQDTYSLVLVETIEYNKVDKDTKEPTGEIGTKEKKTYHPNLAQVLQSYTKEVEMYSTEEGLHWNQIITKMKRIEDKIDELKSIYKIN